jgi:hypothetical protein
MDVPEPKTPPEAAEFEASKHHFSWFSRRMAVFKRVCSLEIAETLSEV